MATQGRIFHTQQTHYIDMELEATDFPVTGSQVVIGVVPANSIIKGAFAVVQTAFSSTSASLPLFVVGTGGTESQRFVVSTDIGLATVGFYNITRGIGVSTTELNITAQLSAGALAAQPTTGKLRYCMEYIPPNDNKQVLTTFN